MMKRQKKKTEDSRLARESCARIPQMKSGVLREEE
jgi:hypothetical protein